MRASPPSGSFKWILVAFLFFVGMINYADRTSITAVYAVLKTDLGFSDVGLGAIGSLFLWSYALASPVAGYLGDRIDRRRVVLWSLFAWSLVTLLTSFVAERWQLLGMRAVLGCTEALYLPSAFALVAEYHSARTRATALGVLSIGQYAGLVGGSTLAGYLADLHGWRIPLFVLGAAGIVLAGIGYFVFGSRASLEKYDSDFAPGEKLSLAAASTGLFRIPSFIVLMIAGALTSIGAWIFINWLPLYFRETFSLSLAEAGFYGASLVSLSAAISQMAGGVISDFVARKDARYRMLMQAVLILCAAPTLLTFIYSRNRTVIMFALVLYSIFRSMGDLNILPLLCDLAGKNKQSTAYGITNMVNTLVAGLGVVVAGYLKADYGLSGVFGGVALILAIDAALLFAGYFLFLRKDLISAKTLSECEINT